MPYIYMPYIYTYTQSPDPSSASTFSLSPAHSTSAQGPGIGAAIRPRGTTRYNSDRWTTIDVYTRYIYIYTCVYIHIISCHTLPFLCVNSVNDHKNRIDASWSPFTTLSLQPKAFPSRPAGAKMWHMLIYT